MSHGAVGGAVIELNRVDVAADPDPTFEVDWVAAVLDTAAATNVGVLDDDELCGRVTRLEAARRKLDAACARAVAELDERAVTDTEHGLRTGSWIAREANEPIGPARRRVRIARRLRDEFPALDDALAAGRVGWHHVEVIVTAANERIAEQIAALCPTLVDLAGEMAFAPWRTEVQRIAARLDVDGGYDPTRDIEANRLFLNRTLSGILDVRGTLVGDIAAAVEEAIERETDRLYRKYRRLNEATDGETDIPSRPTLRALALAELIRHGVADTGGTSAPLTDLTIVHRDDRPGEYETLYGSILSRHDLDCRLCDAAVQLLGISPDGVPLDLHRTHRYANRAQRRAAHARDGGCVFPGCDAPVSWVDLHHVWAWEDGGPTDLPNLARC